MSNKLINQIRKRLKALSIADLSQITIELKRWKADLEVNSVIVRL